jgi:hypothetical protein
MFAKRCALLLTSSRQQCVYARRISSASTSLSDEAKQQNQAALDNVLGQVEQSCRQALAVEALAEKQAHFARGIATLDHALAGLDAPSVGSRLETIRHRIWLSQSSVERECGALDDAEKSARNALECGQKSWRDYWQLALIQVDRGDDVGALELLDGAVELGSVSLPDGALHWTEALLTRSDVHFRLGNTDDCVKDLCTLLVEKPTHVDALRRRASVSMMRQQYANAVSDFGAALGVDNRSTESHIGRAAAHVKLGDCASALKDLAASANIDAAAAYASLGYAYGLFEHEATSAFFDAELAKSDGDIGAVAERFHQDDEFRRSFDPVFQQLLLAINERVQ